MFIGTGKDAITRFKFKKNGIRENKNYRTLKIGAIKKIGYG